MVKENIPYVAVAAMFQKDPQVLMAHKELGLNTLADLKGRPVAISTDAMDTYWKFLTVAFGFTNDSRRVNLLGERIEAGMIGLNSFQISMPESPFGGVKESGHGSEEGIEGLEACLVTKFISVS